MKPSYFNFVFSHAGKNYVYNSISGVLAETDEMFDKIMDNITNGDESLCVPDNETLKKMTESRIIIDDNIDEIAEYETLFEKTKEESSKCTLTIAPSLLCNFSCPYCYETKNEIIMSDDHVNKLIKFIKRSLVGKKFCGITWYGGEPLLCKDIIYKISDEVIAYCEENEIKYDGNIITNGYLLTDEILDNLIKYKVSSAQITLDGDREHHNKKRFLKNGQGSYDRILQNIKKIDAKGIKLSIRINVDINNADNLDSLFDDLVELKLQNSYVYFGLLSPATEACASIANSCLTNENFSQKTLLWNYKLYKRGVFPSLLRIYPKRIISPCAALSSYACVIDSRGNFYKCWNDIGNESKAVGNLDSDESLPFKYTDNLRRYTEWSPYVYSECKKCKVLPLCGGYCAYMAFKDGQPVCSKWKYILEDYLRQVVASAIEQNLNNKKEVNL